MASLTGAMLLPIVVELKGSIGDLEAKLAAARGAIDATAVVTAGLDAYPPGGIRPAPTNSATS
jgi:hypothetical protein